MGDVVACAYSSTGPLIGVELEWSLYVRVEAVVEFAKAVVKYQVASTAETPAMEAFGGGRRLADVFLDEAGSMSA
ncbi:hypothetical protein A5695_04820 [Mycobacterium sp. E1747]|nr:hypothetical protein A5695_04820 [Mycobacterium sp. E1747]